MGGYILLVEDNEINQELALELLGNADILARAANDGREALQILEDEVFDGVLMDVHMPEMDGLTATREIRKQDRLKDLPVIAMTASAMIGDRERALEAGMNDFATKPINPYALFTTMAKWITPAKPLDAAAVGRGRTEPETEAAIPPLAGIDTAAGLAATQGNRALYLRLLRKFRGGQGDFVKRFGAAREDNDPDAATRAAHTLKGVAGNIGAKGIEEAAKALEIVCRESRPEEEIDGLLGAVAIQLDQVIGALDGLDRSSEEAPWDIDEIDREKAGPLLRRLDDLLADDDTDAGEVVEELTGLFRGAKHQAALDRLGALVNGYRFEEARKALEALVAALDIERR